MPLYEAVPFTNISEKHFIGHWDGEPYELEPKSTIHVPGFIARHLAKHLINDILQERYNKLCAKHNISTEDSIRSCEKCKERNAKLITLHTTDDRKPLLDQILAKPEEKKEAPKKEETKLNEEVKE